MTPAAQLAFLSKLDGTAYPPNTIFVFTCNGVDSLESRFLSRCRRVDFSSYGMSEGIVGLFSACGMRKRTAPRLRLTSLGLRRTA